MDAEPVLLLGVYRRGDGPGGGRCRSPRARCVYICLFVCLCACVCVHLHALPHACTRTLIREHMRHTHGQLCTRARTHTHRRTHAPRTHTHTHTGAPRALASVIDGESLFNDGSAMVFFLIFNDIGFKMKEISVAQRPKRQEYLIISYDNELIH